MINMDQVRTLEMKVKQTVALIVNLRQENDSLRGRLSDTEVRLQELEALLEGFKATQIEMESGIRNALHELDNLEGSSATANLHPEAETKPVEEPSADFAPQEVPMEMEEESFPTSSDTPSSVELEEEDFQSHPEDTPQSEFIAQDFSPSEAEQEEPEPQQPGLGIF
jgi:chromosome segregation ATPase